MRVEVTTLQVIHGEGDEIDAFYVGVLKIHIGCRLAFLFIEEKYSVSLVYCRNMDSSIDALYTILLFYFHTLYEFRFSDWLICAT